MDDRSRAEGTGGPEGELRTVTSPPTPSWSGRRTALVTTLLIALAQPAALAATASQACGRSTQGIPRVELPTLRVAVSADRSQYRRGAVAGIRVDVRVLLPEGLKVADAQVKIVISAHGRAIKELHGQTNASGTARAPWKIGSRVPVGRVSAVATAYVLTLDGSDCTGGLVYQTGRGSADPLVTVTP